MSIQLNHYAAIGILVPYGGFKDQMAKHFAIENPDDDGDDIYELTKKYYDSAFEPDCGHNGITILSDGMNGKFEFVGQVLEKTGNYGGFGKPIEFPLLEPTLVAEIAETIKKEVGVTGEIKQYVISHYR